MPLGRSRYLSLASFCACAVVCGLFTHTASAATPPTTAIIAKLAAARDAQAKTPFTLSLTVRDARGSMRLVAKEARCADGKIALAAMAPTSDTKQEGATPDAMILSKDASGSALALWITLCEPNPLEVLGARGGLIASEVEILATAAELYYQLGTAQKLLVSHDLGRVLGVTLKQDGRSYRALARGRMTPETTLPNAVVVWVDERQTITATLSALPQEK